MSPTKVSRILHPRFITLARPWSTSFLGGSMSVRHWLAPVLLCTVASPLSATDDLGDLARAYVAAHTTAHLHLPSYARQTGLACSACHYQFLMLTPFGRKFKLNGYTLTNLVTINEKDSTNGGRLSL